MRKMVILPGNSGPANKYPDPAKFPANPAGKHKADPDDYPAWPDGALDWDSALDYAHLLRFDPVPVKIPGQPQSHSSPQTTQALTEFHKDVVSVTGFYGFSGGGYNVYWFLDYLLLNEPENLYHIEQVTVIGAPKRHKSEYTKETFNLRLGKLGKKVAPARWDLDYLADAQSDSPGVPKDVSAHMFGPRVLLLQAQKQQSGTPP
jgi:hypothetical protein